MLRIKILTASMLVSAALAAGQMLPLPDAAARFDTTRSATSSIRTYVDSNGDPVIETTNAQYEFQELWIGGDTRNESNRRMATFLETINRKHTLGLDSYQSTVS